MLAMLFRNKGQPLTRTELHSVVFYEWLWTERSIRSMAYPTRRDAEAFMAMAPKAPGRAEKAIWPLGQANQAWAALLEGTMTGAAVLMPPCRDQGVDT